MNHFNFEWSASVVAMPGQIESGDQYLAQATADGILFAVIDGVGHGSEAAEAATIASITLQQHANDSLIDMLQHCHESLRATRGVAMSLVTFNSRTATLAWLGVGNVEATLSRKDTNLIPEKLLLRNGLVGAHLPMLQATTITVNPGDVLIMATDGVANDFSQYVVMNDSTECIAQRIQSTANKGTDDASVLVARFNSDGISDHES